MSINHAGITGSWYSPVLLVPPEEGQEVGQLSLSAVLELSRIRPSDPTMEVMARGRWVDGEEDTSTHQPPRSRRFEDGTSLGVSEVCMVTTRLPPSCGQRFV